MPYQNERDEQSVDCFSSVGDLVVTLGVSSSRFRVLVPVIRYRDVLRLNYVWCSCSRSWRFGYCVSGRDAFRVRDITCARLSAYPMTTAGRPFGIYIWWHDMPLGLSDCPVSFRVFTGEPSSPQRPLIDLESSRCAPQPAGNSIPCYTGADKP